MLAALGGRQVRPGLRMTAEVAPPAANRPAWLSARAHGQLARLPRLRRPAREVKIKLNKFNKKLT